MEEFLAFNQVGHFDFSFGSFNVLTQQPYKTWDHTSSAILLLLSTKINLFPLCGHSCLYNPSDMCRNQMEVNKKKKKNSHFIYIFFYLWNGVVGCSTCRFDNIWPNTQTPIIIHNSNNNNLKGKKYIYISAFDRSMCILG